MFGNWSFDPTDSVKDTRGLLLPRLALCQFQKFYVNSYLRRWCNVTMLLYSGSMGSNTANRNPNLPCFSRNSHWFGGDMFHFQKKMQICWWLKSCTSLGRVVYLRVNIYSRFSWLFNATVQELDDIRRANYGDQPAEVSSKKWWFSLMGIFPFLSRKMLV